MIFKSFETNRINKKINQLILFYGKNEGLKNEALRILIKDESNIQNYEEKEILDNENNFVENILSKSLFEKEKFIVIKRVTDKILKVVESLHLKNLEDTTIILNSDNLEKKSKLRSLFEKDKKLVCVPFYPDNSQTLSKLAYNFLNVKKISISPSNINLIVGSSSALTAAPKPTDTITILRNTNIQQLTKFIERGTMPVKNIERALDLLTLINCIFIAKKSLEARSLHSRQTSVTL